MKYNIPKGVTKVCDFAFEECKKVKNIILPDTITEIGNYSFAHSTNLKEITIPKSIKNIGNNIFNKNHLIVYGEKDSLIDEYIKNNYDIKEITFIDIKESKNLKKVEKEIKELEKFEEIEKIKKEFEYIIKNNQVIITNYLGRAKKVIIPEKIEDKLVIEIGEKVFYFEDIENVVMPDSIIKIGEKAFYYSKIKEIKLSENLVEISEEVFYGCKRLKNIEMPKSIKKIGKDAFERRNLKIIGEIGSYAEEYSKKYRIEFISSSASLEEIRISEEFAKQFDYCVTEDNSIKITGIKKESESLVIPSKVNGKLIKKIDNFYTIVQTVKKISISENINEINLNFRKTFPNLESITIDKNNKFFSCDDNVLFNKDKSEILQLINRNIISYKVPSSVTTIREHAFDNCNSITEIEIGENVNLIGARAFEYCRSLSDVVIKNSHIQINSYAFFGTKWINECEVIIFGKERLYKYNGKDETFKVPDEVKFIEEDAFAKNNTLKKVIIGEDVETIGDRAFEGCSNLNKINIPLKTEMIGEKVFQGCINLLEIDIENSDIQLDLNDFKDTKWINEHELIAFRKKLFKYNGKSETFEIPSEIKFIEKGAFAYNNILKKVIIGENVEKIEKYAFKGCSNLNKIDIPLKTEIIGYRAFEECTNLYEINISANIKTIGEDVFASCKSLKKINVSKDNHYYSDTDGILFDKEKKVLICFPCNSQIKDYIIPKSVIRIENRAFYSNKFLKSIKLGENIKEIGPKAFEYCRALEEVYFNYSSLTSKIFEGCTNLYEINILANVKKIEKDAFVSYKSLKKINVSKDNEYYSDIHGILFDKEKTVLIHCPSNSQIKDYIIPKSVIRIENRAFSSNKFLKSINLGENIKEIGPNAFEYCEILQEVYFNCSGLTSSGINIFEGCKCIEKIIFSEELNFIGTRLFASTEISKVELPKNVTQIGLGCFAGAKEIVVYDTITPNAKEATEHWDDCNGKPNSNLGYIGLSRRLGCAVCAAFPNTIWHDHMITVKSSKTDEILYKVWMGGEDENRGYYCMLASSWGKNATFNFEKLDEVFNKIKKFDNKIKVAINRLKYPVSLTEEYKDKYEKYLKRSTKKLVDNNNLEALLEIEKYQLISKANIDNLIDYANKNKNLEILSYLMNYKNKYLMKK